MLTGDHENRVTDYTAIVCYTAKRYAQYEEQLPTLRASGGDIGGGSEGIVVYEDLSESHRCIVCEHSSRELHRTGCVQRYVSCDREGWQ